MVGLGQFIIILGSYWPPLCHLDGSTVWSISHNSIPLFQLSLLKGQFLTIQWPPPPPPTQLQVTLPT